MVNEYLMDEMDEIIYISDIEDYTIRYVNVFARKLLGIQDIEYRSKKCYEVFQGRKTPCPFCTNHLLTPDAYYIWEYSNTYLNRHFLVKDKLINWEGRISRIEFAIDITDKEVFSRFLCDKLSSEQTLIGCIRSLLAVESLEEAVNEILQDIGFYYQADRAYMIEIDSKARTASYVYEWCTEGVMKQQKFLQNIPLHEIPLWSNAYDKEESLIVKDILSIKDSNLQEYIMLKAQNIYSFYVIPFRAEGILSGCIGIDNPRVHLDNISFLESLVYFVKTEIVKRKMNERLKYLSYYDELSGLLNRNSYVEYLSTSVKNKFSSLGIIVADINGLKQLNQEYGHGYGDTVVKKAAEILKQQFDETTIFRLNGDEFIVICENMDRQEFISTIRSIQAEFKQMNDNGVSIGYTWSNMDIDIKALIHHADELMFINKQEYYQNPNAVSKHRSILTQDLIEAIKIGKFHMYLQPKADIQTGKIVGAEALVRYCDEKYDIVAPGQFIPLLEKERIIRYIDFFIFEEVCRTLEKWKKAGHQLIPISLNFSRITMLETDLTNLLLAMHSKYDVPRELIEIEITESIGEMERETIAEISASIKQLGFGISLDDFGSKYTSMSLLTIMKFNVLKLDRSLVNELAQNVNSQSVVKHVIEMCRDMEVQSVAEGVETQEQLELLKQLFCDVAQGYLFSKPISLEEYEEKFLPLHSSPLELKR